MAQHSLARVAHGIGLRLYESRLVRATVYRKYHRAEAARQYLWLLDTGAVSVIPELRTMLQDESHPDTAVRALVLLSHLVLEGFQVMDAALADTNQPFPEDIALLMGHNIAHYLGTNTCLPRLRAAMADPNPPKFGLWPLIW